MNKIQRILKQLFEENIKQYNSWRQPTPSELQNEWDTELKFANLSGIPDSKKQLRNTYKELILNNLNKFSSVETLNEIPTTLDIYRFPDIKSLKKIISHYGKDIDRLVNAFNNNEPLPLPIFIQDENELQILGGRTRISVAKILNITPIKVIVINKNKLTKFLQPYWIKDFKNNIDNLFMNVFLLEPKDYQEQIKNYILGNLKEFPNNNTVLPIQLIKKEAEHIKNKLFN